MHKHQSGSLAGAASLALLAMAATQDLHAQAWPVKPVRLIVAFAPGSSADVMTRHFAPKYSEIFGQQFIVDNRNPAGGVGVVSAAASPADGYNFMTATAAFTVEPALRKHPKYDLARDFDPIILYAYAPFNLLVHPSLPVRNVKELIALAKAKPGELSFGSSVTGSTSHLVGEFFNMQAGVKIVNVPYKGTSAAVTDFIGGRIQMMFANNLGQQVRSGRLRALATTGTRRTAIDPDLPTMIEAGVPGFDATTWFALVAPKGTPREPMARLNEATEKLLKTAEIRTLLLNNNSAEPMGGTPEQAAAYIKQEVVKWEKVVRAAGVSLD